ncbi:MAG: D-3-phosphoglycerate dehydrogenase [Idiomarina sp. T82-3]|jgi:D-3-phosphoglycerate dehydrogenase|uniref:phosphoglycerate dehydrogenase n=1 Tax=Idiomarina TaxID=135575 RepID=UPI0007961DD4|nr:MULTISPECIES: phosphoglycerate dehydrogenase [unclassified Idiomarina]KXS36337.1 MAG: D-3-phosphoglycerate dehydrogenase [Idiomarina sp. T82-3]MAF74935.1 phosphoglycerate dehydrogenase [Idiomarinaceae bacterium]|tara:strand:+ start:568 stop:1797 length:1230 start_codon:yes stop_codon:yes gene_type:complete
MAVTSLAKDKIKVLLLEGVHDSAIELLKQQGYDQLEILKGSLDEDELCEKIKDVHMIGIRSRTQLTEKVFAAAEKLIAVGCFCIGTNQVDLKAAQKHGVVVFNAPFSNTRSVAELVLAETIMLLRGIPQKNAQAHKGGWLKSANHAYEVRGKILGIVGYGHIGSQLSVLAEQLGMQVIYYDVETKLPMGNARSIKRLDDLLAKADVVTLHVPETPSTRWMIGSAQLAKMKPNSLLINASRGTVVDIEALAEALTSGHLAGAAIDVFPVEPQSNQDLFESPLCGIENCLLTPHIGGSTVEAQENIGIEVAGKLVHYSDNGSTLSAVNFPEVSLPQHATARRLLHIHKNQPGMMNAINSILSDFEINVAGQYLQTDENVGYVVMDIDTDNGTELLDKMKAIPGTIRARQLF